MKRAYFQEGQVDADDLEHARAVEEAIVPPKCLLGGVLIWHFHAQDIDPCSVCPWDRDKCGGRPKNTSVVTPHNAQLLNMGNAGAYSDIRSRQIAEMDRLADEVEAVRKGSGT